MVKQVRENIIGMLINVRVSLFKNATVQNFTRSDGIVKK
jgi:hypothetical protein